MEGQGLRMKCCGIYMIMFFVTSLCWADFRASIYKIDSNDRELLFSQEFIEKELDSGQIKIENRYKNSDGIEVIRESATLNKTGQIQDIQIDQLQTSQKAYIKIDQNKIEFELTQANGSQKKSTEKRKQLPLVSTQNFGYFIRDSWKKIVAGETVEFRLIVWDRLETVGFQVISRGMKTIRGKSCMAVEMQASTFLIRQLVDPLQLCYTDDGRKIFDLTGRVAPKIKIGEQYKDLDAHVVYFY